MPLLEEDLAELELLALLELEDVAFAELLELGVLELLEATLLELEELVAISLLLLDFAELELLAILLDEGSDLLFTMTFVFAESALLFPSTDSPKIYSPALLLSFILPEKVIVCLSWSCL